MSVDSSASGSSYSGSSYSTGSYSTGSYSTGSYSTGSYSTGSYSTGSYSTGSSSKRSSTKPASRRSSALQIPDCPHLVPTRYKFEPVQGISMFFRKRKVKEWVSGFQPENGKLDKKLTLLQSLRNGIALQNIVLKVDADRAKKCYDPKVLTEQKIGSYPNWERIKGFIAFCESYGCDEAHILHAEQLWNPNGQKDLESLMITLETLSSLIDAKGHDQPFLIGRQGVKVEVESDVYKGVFERLFVRNGCKKKIIKEPEKVSIARPEPELKKKKKKRGHFVSGDYVFEQNYGRNARIAQEMHKTRQKMLQKYRPSRRDLQDFGDKVFDGPYVFSRPF